MASLEALKQSVSGIVITREEASCPAAGRPERFPDAIVGATSVEDVQAVVRFARQHGLKVTARRGGHAWSGVALQEGIVIDVSALKLAHEDLEAQYFRACLTNKSLSASSSRPSRTQPGA